MQEREIQNPQPGSSTQRNGAVQKTIKLTFAAACKPNKEHQPHSEGKDNQSSLNEMIKKILEKLDKQESTNKMILDRISKLEGSYKATATANKRN